MIKGPAVRSIKKRISAKGGEILIEFKSDRAWLKMTLYNFPPDALARSIDQIVNAAQQIIDAQRVYAEAQHMNRRAERYYATEEEIRVASAAVQANATQRTESEDPGTGK